MLEKRQIQYNMSLLVEELVRGIHSPPPPAAPTPPGPSVEERFTENNPYLHYQSDYYTEAEALWGEVAPEGGAWDETLASLRKVCRGETGLSSVPVLSLYIAPGSSCFLSQFPLHPILFQSLYHP